MPDGMANGYYDMCGTQLSVSKTFPDVWRGLKWRAKGMFGVELGWVHSRLA
jgi:hypothetical protein